MLFSASRVCLVLTLICCGALNGCSLLGAAMSKMPKPDIAAAYKGLAGQTVGVMVWADRSTLLVDWPSLPLHLGESVAYKLKQAQDSESKELVGMTFPYPPASYLKYQRENPGIDALPITDVAAKLNVSRLIYLEINDFSTRIPNSAMPMYLGTMDVSLKVIEIENGKGTVAYQEDHITVQYPRNSPKEGGVGKSDREMYVGTLDEMSSTIAVRFFQHPDPSN